MRSEHRVERPYSPPPPSDKSGCEIIGCAIAAILVLCLGAGIYFLFFAGGTGPPKDTNAGVVAEGEKQSGPNSNEGADKKSLPIWLVVLGILVGGFLGDKNLNVWKVIALVVAVVIVILLELWWKGYI